uniref:uncharacterized protein LOC120335239 n=1 Tax=Styela clava TaxID=7725 RepID=UPI00193A9150|nr:uncharacterized protein LOC120335239 [Styela clava]
MSRNVKSSKIFLTDSRISEDGSLLICGQYSKDEDEINNLMESIKSETASFKPITNAELGNPCLALFAEDGQLYRGKLISKASDSYLVEFIDYGNIQRTKIEDLWQLPEHFQKIDRKSCVFKLCIAGTSVKSAALWTPIIPSVIQEEYLYSEIEIEESVDIDGSILCQSIDAFLRNKKLIDDEQQYPFNLCSVGSKFDAYVVHSSAEGHIQIQLKATEKDLNALMDDIATFYTSATLTDLVLQPESISIGSLVCAVYSVDGGFYRGQVRKIDRDKCFIYFIDYGGVEEKSINNLFKLPDNLCSLPYQAIDCKFDGIVFSTSFAMDKICETITTFAEDKIFSVTVKQCLTAHTLLVDMHDHATGKDFAEHLIENGLSSSKIVNQNVPNHKTYHVGEKANMLMTWLETDGTFFCYNVLSDDLLSEQLNSLYKECSSGTVPVLKCPSIGNLCCAPYLEDGNWYRACILKLSDNIATVRFVDYGNTQTCDVTSILELSDQFRKMPIQGIHCLLSSNLDNNDLIHALSVLRDQEVVVEFVNVDIEPYAVCLYHNGSIVGLRTTSPDLERSTQLYPMTILPKDANIYKHHTLTIGAKKDIILRETNNLKSLWCVLTESHADLQNLTNEINEMYNSVIEGTYDLNPAQSDYGGPCVTQDPKDGMWYRSKLLSITGPNECKVLYVDCGRTEIVLKNSVKIISEGLLKLPVFALRFTLTSILSMSGVPLPVDQWRMLLQQGKNKSFAGVFTDYDVEKDLYFVALHDIAGHFKAKATGSDVKVQLLNVPLNVEVPIRITSVENPGCIWVQLLDYQANLIVLTGRLNAYYNELPNHALILENIYPGQICCMKSSKTKNWCRGEIAFMYDDVIEVKFFDFGYVESAHLSDAKTLMPDFLSLPCQAVCCCIHNLRPNSQKWCNGSVRYLKEFVAKTGVSAKFVDLKMNVYAASILVSTKDENILLGSRLVSKGLASWADSNAELEGETPLRIPSPQVLPQSAHVFFGHPGISLIGAQFPVIVCEPAVPNDFFVLPANSEVKVTYAKLRRELRPYAQLDSPIQTNMYVGMPCVCVLRSDCFRAAVVSNDDPQNPVVFLVDYGEKKQVPIDCLKSISPIHITCIPPVAIRCTLHGILEPENEFWSSKALLLFSKFCKENKRDLVCTIYGCVTDGVSQFFMVKFQTPFQDIASDLVKSANCTMLDPIGNMFPPFALKSFVYSSLGAGIGKEDQFYVTHVERSDLFYCQLSSKFEEIDGFMDRVQNYCSKYKQKKIVTVKDLEFSPLCLVLYEDGKWYRAHYNSNSIHSPKDTVAEVIFVDYGNIFVTPLSNIILCEKDSGLSDVSIFALACCLSEIITSNSDLAISNDIFIRMKEKLERRQLSGIVTGSTNGRLHLDFFVNQQRLNEMIITGNVSPITLPAKDEKFRREPSLKGKFKDIPAIEPKTVHSVYISQVKNPNYIHVRLAEYEEQFKECMSEVDGFYTAVRRQDYSVQHIQNGNVICAKHPLTLRWCRGIVIDCVSKEPDEALVEFVDIGEQEFVSIEDNIKRLVPGMLHWPRLTIKCQLANVLPVGKSWDPESTEFFLRTVQYVNCRIRFNAYDVTNRTWAIDIKIEGQNVAHMLVENNFAKCVKVPSSQASGCSEYVKTKKINSWPQGTARKVYISHVESINQVYLQPVESEAALNTLMNKLNDSSLVMKNVANRQLRLDISYAAKFNEDKQYYRANLLSLPDLKKPDSIHVIYTDYGNEGFVKIEDFRHLPKEFTILPEQAIKCNVKHPVGIDKEVLTAKLESLAGDENSSISAECVKIESLTFLVDLTIVDTNQKRTKFLEFFARTEPSAEASLQYTKIDVKTNIQTKVYVAQIDNPQRIWIQLSSNAPDLDKIMSEIDVFCNTNSTKLTEFQTSTPCLAKYSADDGWYRGMIQDYNKTLGSATIHFVDYGNTEAVKLGNLKPMNIQFIKLPVQAILCKLRNMIGLDYWTTNDTDDFVDRVSDVQLTALFHLATGKTSGKFVSNVYDVDLIYPCGKSLNTEWNETLKDRTINLTTDASRMSEGAGDSLINTKNTISLHDSENHIVTDRGDHVIVENLVPQTASIDFDTSTYLKTPNIVSDLESLFMESGAIENGFISHCNDPGHFYVQLAKHVSDLDQIYMNTAQNTSQESVEVGIGRYCIAKSPDDDEWYRAKCVDIRDEKFIVQFIDYGNTATIDSNNLKPMSDVLKCFPIQAIECKLHGVIPVQTGWDSVTDSFLDLTLDKDLKIEFIKQTQTGIWFVKLNFEGLDIGEKLLKENDGKLVSSCSAKTSLEGNSQTYQLQVGCILCAKVVDIDISGNFTGFLLNISTHKLVTELKNFVKTIKDDGGYVSIRFEDLHPGTVCMYKTFAGCDWQCVRIIRVGCDGKAKAFDISNKRNVELDSGENMFIDVTPEIRKDIDKLFVNCVTKSSMAVKLHLENDLGKIVAINLLSLDEALCRWIVKTSFLKDNVEESTDENTLQVDPILQNGTPSILITNTERKSSAETRSKTGNKSDIGNWINEHFSKLVNFFSLGEELFLDCPSALAPLHVAMFRSKYAIALHLTEEEKARFDIKPQDESPINDRLKRISGELMQINENDSLPAKKLKLDMNKNNPGFGGTETGMFSVGNKFEAIISSVVHPGQFYVRPFLVMSEPVTLEPTSKFKDVKNRLKKLLPDMLCIAKCSDSSFPVHHWVRAIVEDCDGENISVKDIDTGIRFVALAENVFPIGEKVESWPSFCMHCSLAGIQPCNSSGEGWSDTAIKKLDSLLGSLSMSDCIEVHIVSIVFNPDLCQDIYEVDVFLNEKSVAETLITLQVAEKIHLKLGVDKENQVCRLKKSDDLDRGETRRPFTILMPKGIKRQPSAILRTPNSSDSVGHSMPNFDLLAVPWRVIRTSIERYSSGSLSDSVFVSDVEDSFIGSAEHPPIVKQQTHLTSFKIYCSTISSESPDEGETTLAADSIENILISNIRTEISEASVSSSLLNLLTPATATSSEQNDNKITGQNIESQDVFEMKLKEVARQVVEEVFQTIETEDDIGNTISEILDPEELTKMQKENLRNPSSYHVQELAEAKQEEEIIHAMESLVLTEMPSQSIDVVDSFTHQNNQPESNFDSETGSKEQNVSVPLKPEIKDQEIKEVQECISIDINNIIDENLELVRDDTDNAVVGDVDLCEIPNPNVDVAEMNSQEPGQQLYPVEELDADKIELPSSGENTIDEDFAHKREEVDDLSCEMPNPDQIESKTPQQDMMQNATDKTGFMPENGSYVLSMVEHFEKQQEQTANQEECYSDLPKSDVEDPINPDFKSNIEDHDFLKEDIDKNEKSTEVKDNIFDEIKDEEDVENDIKASVDQCSYPHANQRFYICCLPKMQLEVGDPYPVAYLSSKDPHNIQLQFDMGTDSDEWRSTLCKINDAKHVNELVKLDSWETDMMCLVQCPSDGSWDRGRIVSTENDEKYIVELVDYADVMTATIDQLREIPESLCLYPRQTVQCSLGGITMREEKSEVGSWSSDVNQYLNDLLFCNTLKAEVLQVNESTTEECYTIQLFVLDDNSVEIDVAKALIDANLAQKLQKDEEKKGDDEWSTMTDSAWETLLNPDFSSTDQLHSSNVDLSSMDDPYPDQNEAGDSLEITPEKTEEEKSPTDEEVHKVAHDIKTKVLAGALIIAQIEDNNSLGDKFSGGKKRRKSKDIYIDLEKIPQILVEAYESTEID